MQFKTVYTQKTLKRFARVVFLRIIGYNKENDKIKIKY